MSEPLKIAISEHALAVDRRDRANDAVELADSQLEAVRIRLDQLSPLDGRVAKFHAAQIAAGADHAQAPLPQELAGAIKERSDLQARRADLHAARIVLAQDLADATTAAHAAAAHVRTSAAPLEIAAGDELVKKIDALETELADVWLRFATLARSAVAGTYPALSSRAQTTLRRRPPAPMINSSGEIIWKKYLAEATAWRKSLLTPIAA